MKKPLRILLVEDNPGDADLIREMLPQEDESNFTVHCVSRLSEAVAYLKQNQTDIALLDLDLPDSKGIDTVRCARQAAPGMPIVVLTGNLDDRVGIAAVQGGAQDYLVKGQTHRSHLSRAIHYSLERHQAEEQVHKSERLLKSTLDALSAHIAIIDASGRILAVNKAWREFGRSYGRSSLRCEEGANYFEACRSICFQNQETTAGAKAFADGIRAVLERDKEHFQIEYTMPCDNKTFWFFGRVTPFPDNGGRRVVVAHEDITARKKAEAEKMQLAAQLRHTYKMEAIGTLAGGIAHDFNNILSSVLGFTELSLLEIGQKNRVEKNLKEIYKAGMRAKELIQQILTFARKDENHIQPTQISAIADEAIKLIRSIIPPSIHIRLKAESQAFVMADPSQIHQIFMNLLTNAAQAMESEGGELTVHIQEVALDHFADSMHTRFKPGAYLRITVTDTGIGIAPEQLEKIFDPYYTTKDRGKGTGLGLSVVHGIVENCGGEINVESTRGKGTTLTIYLPLSTRSAAVVDDICRKLPAGTERILFVDDESSIAEMSRERLSILGYRVTTVNHGSKALDLLRQKPDGFDLLITDMTMPGMPGDQLALAAKKIKPQMPVILCTGYSKKMSKQQAKAIGIDAFLMKPVPSGDLAETIHRVLNKKNKN
jgi:signal transduction histidine kinase/CheY-like chemotaxis protein